MDEGFDEDFVGTLFERNRKLHIILIFEVSSQFIKIFLLFRETHLVIEGFLESFIGNRDFKEPVDESR